MASKKKSQYVYWEHKYLTVFILCHIFFPLSFLKLFCISVIFYTQTLLRSPSWNRSTLYCHHFFTPKLLLVFLRNSCRFVSSFGKTWLSEKPVVLLPLREWFYTTDSLGCGSHFSETPVSQEVHYFSPVLQEWVAASLSYWETSSPLLFLLLLSLHSV